MLSQYQMELSLNFSLMKNSTSEVQIMERLLSQVSKKAGQKSKKTETNANKAVAKVGKNLQLNKYYTFHVTNALKLPPVKEEPPHINEA